MKITLSLITFFVFFAAHTQFTYYNYESFYENGLKGIREKKSKKVIAKAVYEWTYPYDHITYKNDAYFIVQKKKSKAYNLISLDGKEVFPKSVTGIYITRSCKPKKEVTCDEFTFKYIDGQSVTYNFASKSIKALDKSIAKATSYTSAVKIEKLAINGKKQYGLHDNNGKELLAASYDEISVYDKEATPYALLKKNGRENIFNLKTKQLLFPENQVDCMLGSKVIRVVKNDGDVAFYSLNLEKINPKESYFDKVTVLNNNLAKVKVGAYYGVMNKSGKTIIPFYNKYIAEAGNNFVVGNAQNSSATLKYGMVTQSNQVVVPLKYDAIWGSEDGMCATKQNGKFGYFNTSGKLVIPHKYDNVEFFHDGQAEVKINGEWIWIDKTGKEVITVSTALKDFKITYASLGQNVSIAGNFLNENVFIWNPTTGENRTYYSGKTEKLTESIFKTSGKLSIPSQYLRSLLTNGDLEIELSINQSVTKKKYKHGSPIYENDIIYTALAYNRTTGKAKVFAFNGGTFVFAQDLDQAIINKIKGSNGEIRMKLNAIPVDIDDKAKYTFAGLITAWNTKSGKNVSFLQNANSSRDFVYHPSFNIPVPTFCKGAEGNVMMDITSFPYIKYGNIVFDHLIYNSSTHNSAIYRNEIKIKDFFTAKQPIIASSTFKYGKDNPISHEKIISSKIKSKDVTMSIQCIANRTYLGNHIVSFVDNKTGYGNCAEVKSFGFITASNKQTQPSIKEIMVDLKKTKTDKIVGHYDFTFPSLNELAHRYILFNQTTGDLDILDFNKLTDKSSPGEYYTPFGLNIRNNVLFE